MSVELLMVALGVGAAALALWIDVRLPWLAPQGVPRIVLHLVLATLATRVGVPLGMRVLADEQPLLAVLLVALPALVYCMLAGCWVLRALQRALPHAR